MSTRALPTRGGHEPAPRAEKREPDAGPNYQSFTVHNSMTNDFVILHTSRWWSSLGKISVTLLLLCGVLVLGGSVCRAADEEDEIPEPENVTLDTKDGLNLKCTWFAGTKGKATVPIIMLHGFLGNRNEYFPLAKYLQNEGHAVIVPDLRGHGGSTKYKNGTVFKATEMKDSERTAVFTEMMNIDVEACKKFLMQQHNDGELNIELLCVIGAEASTVLAVNWAVADWAVPSVPAYKQGQDVKALILLSPEMKIEKTTLTNVNALKVPIVSGKGLSERLSIMIAYGSGDHKAAAEARKFYDPFKRARPAPEKKDEIRLLDLFFDDYDTELQGTKLLDPRVKLPINKRISNFITLRLVNRQNNLPKWQDRKKPL